MKITIQLDNGIWMVFDHMDLLVSRGVAKDMTQLSVLNYIGLKFKSGDPLQIRDDDGIVGINISHAIYWNVEAGEAQGAALPAS